jgi:alpha-glucosidase
MYVDDKTMNALGRRSDKTVRHELIAAVFPPGDNGASEFTLYEDDGVTIAYQNGQVRTTKLSQVKKDDTVTVTVHESQGTYANAPATRKNVVRLAADKVPQSVSLNSAALPKKSSAADFAAADSGWYYDATKKTVSAKSGSLPVASAKKFVFVLGPGAAEPCTSQYDFICIPGTGNGWNPNDPGRMLLRDRCTTRVWKGYNIPMTCEQYKFAANGSWAVNWGSNGKQDGPNFPPLAKAGIYNVTWNEAAASAPVFQRQPGPSVTTTSARFVCENGVTNFGISVYVVGNIPELGSWDSKNAVKLEPDGPYPKWTGVIGGLPANTAIEWKCIKRQETGDQQVTQWEPGANNAFTTPDSGFAGDQKAQF